MAVDPGMTFSVEPPQKGWFARNWFWFIPLVVGMPILLCGGCCVGLIFFSRSVVDSLPPYKNAVDTVLASDQVQQKLGTPLRTGTLPTHVHWREDSGSGRAEFDFTVSGPKGSADVSTVASKTGGTWKTTTLNVTFDDGEEISLVAEGASDDEPE